jgi:hypothetical protein
MQKKKEKKEHSITIFLIFSDQNRQILRFVFGTFVFGLIWTQLSIWK